MTVQGRRGSAGAVPKKHATAPGQYEKTRKRMGASCTLQTASPTLTMMSK